MNRKRPRGHGPASRRRGVTLIELMITLVLLGIVAGGMMQIIVRQQKFYNGNSGVLGTRSNVRQGIAVFQSDLRALNPALDVQAGDMKSTSFAFREPRGSSAACATDGSQTIVVPPPVLSNGAGITSWVEAPQVGDSVLVYDTNARAWFTEGAEVSGSQPTEGSGSCTGLVPVADQGRGWQITLKNPVSGGTVTVGAPIRFFRHAKYELAQAGDGEWYLAFSDCTPSCGDPQPIAGPYLAPDNSPPGMALSYLDQNGNPTTDPTQLRLIDIVLRSRSSTQVDMDGRKKGFYQDSLRTSIAVRN